LNGIVSTNDLWLTHLRFSNDDEEMTHGQNIVAETLEARKKTPEPGQLPYLECLEKLLGEPVSDGVYICCLCAKDNLLSQWRGYAADGAGVSIELNHREFDFLTGPDSPHGLLRLWKIFYKEDQQRDIIAKAIEFGWKYQTHLPIEKRAQNAASHRDPMQRFSCNFVQRATCSFRIIRCKSSDGIQRNRCRSRRCALGRAKALNVQSAQLLLKQRNYTDVPVRVSETPFRG